MARASAFDLIICLGTERRGVYLRPPCNDETLRQLQIDAGRDLGEEIPQSYVVFLRLTNGVQINCGDFWKAEHLVLNNLDADRQEVIILGQEGNMADYVFDKRDRKFHIVNMGFPDERFSSYDTFEEMLAAVLKEQQVV